MSTTRIRWTGPERNIPPYGHVSFGEAKELPAAVAESYIMQGLAVRFRPAKPDKTASKEG